MTDVTWLDKAFFSKVLRQHEKDADIKVKNVQVAPATAEGAHYASVMFRALVEYQQNGADKKKSLIVKTLPVLEGVKKELLGDSYVFETEIAMYTEAMQKFEDILKANGDDTVLKVSCLYHTLTPKKIIVFEDLSALDYKMVSNRTLTLEEIKATYLKLAKWHAVSYKLLQEDPNCFEKFRYPFMAMPNIKENKFIVSGIYDFCDMLDGVPTLQKYKQYFEPMKEDLLDKCIAGFKEYIEDPQSEMDYVLCHGDFHGKNLMFKHNPVDNRPEDVMLLDFQISYVGSIADDLVYSTFMMLNAEQRANHLDELFYFYFTNFQATLRKIGFRGAVPKLLEFRQQIGKRKDFSLLLLVAFLPMWIALRDGQDIEKMIESEDYRKRVYFNKEYTDELHTLLPKLLHQGYLET